MRPCITLVSVAVLTLIFLLAIVSTWEPPGEQLKESSTTGADLLELFGTGGRLRGDDHPSTAASYSQAVYPVSQDKDRPGAVILVRDDDPAVAMATTRLQHFPVNAPMLYLTDNGTNLPETTKDELERLDPEGVMMDRNVQVYLAGNIGEEMVSTLESLDYKVQRIFAEDPISYTEVLDEYISSMEGNHWEIVHVVNINELEYGLPAANWNAHAGDGLVFVTDEEVPEGTKRILERRWPHYPYMYVFAPTSVVDYAIMEELSKYGHVQRIPGDTPQEMSVRWAGYKDSGRRVSWWFDYETRSVGWGIAEAGHNLVVANPSDWRDIVPSGVLSHMGKHAFLILTEEDGSLPDAAIDYLNVIRPTKVHPSQQVFNFAWVVGRDVPEATVTDLNNLLAVKGA